MLLNFKCLSSTLENFAVGMDLVKILLYLQMYASGYVKYFKPMVAADWLDRSDLLLSYTYMCYCEAVRKVQSFFISRSYETEEIHAFRGYDTSEMVQYTGWYARKTNADA